MDECARRFDPRVVYKNIQSPEALYRKRDRLLHRSRIRHIHSDGPPPELRCDSLRTLDIQIGYHYAGTLFRETGDRGFAETRGAAGNKHHFSRKILHFSSPSLR